MAQTLGPLECRHRCGAVELPRIAPDLFDCSLRPVLQESSIGRTMRSAWNMDGLRRLRIIRGLAVLFLLFTLVDILCPPACCENAELLSAARDNYSRVVAGAGDEASSVAVSSQSGTEHSPDKNCCDQDCCLLCAHMLPVKALGFELVPDTKSPLLVVNDASVLSPSLDATYHPPRFL
jgi:hypothetical protein